MACRTREVSRRELCLCKRGSAANTAVGLSRLGRKVTIVGGIGNDDLGNIALRSIISAGVNIDHVIRRSDWKTGCAAIRSMGESKSILTAGIVDPIIVFDSLRTLGVQQGDHLHFSWAPAEEMHPGRDCPNSGIFASFAAKTPFSSTAAMGTDASVTR